MVTSPLNLLLGQFRHLSGSLDMAYHIALLAAPAKGAAPQSSFERAN